MPHQRRITITNPPNSYSYNSHNSLCLLWPLYRAVLGFVLVALSSYTMAAPAESSDLVVSKGNNKFTNNFYASLVKNDATGNIFFSPISAHAVLSMVYQGAAGKTTAAFAKTLQVPSADVAADGYKSITERINAVQNVTLRIANKVYVYQKSTLKPTFKDVIQKKFYSDVEALDFAKSAESAQTINTWVENSTNKKIKDLIKANDLSSDTRLVLVNAIYFKGNWLHKFDKDRTRTEPFYINENDKIDVQMMHISEDFGFKHDDDLKAKVLELTYTDKSVSMVIVLPDERTGLKEVEKKLANYDLSKLTEGLYSREVVVALPKFKIETEIDLKEHLENLGLGIIFTDGADFSGLLEGGEPLVVSKAIQKAFIEVNEEGAEAAAATGLQIMLIRARRQTYFLVDHPFLILLHANENVLFVGRVNKPVAGDGTIAPAGEPLRDPHAHIFNVELVDD